VCFTVPRRLTLRQQRATRDPLADAWAIVISSLGYPADSPHFADSPRRVAKFLREWHTRSAEPPKLTTFPAAGHDEMVVVRGITFHSMCAHHGLPFFGTAMVGYLPKTRLVGLSKLARVVDYFARRFQVQETLSSDIADYLERELKPRGLGVVLTAEHMCMSMRGIQKPGHSTTTSVMRGAFRRQAATRAEFLGL
jgi:GTP cyclohydrolase IA